MDKIAFFTMDVESYFDTSCVKNKNIDKDQKYNCAEDILKYASFLSSHNIKGTFFVTIDFIKYSKPYLLKVIKLGHEIGLHCYSHHSYKKVSIEDFKKELIESKRILKEELNIVPVGFRFPSFKYRPELLDVLKEQGFIYDSSVKKVNKHYQKIYDRVYFYNGLFEFSPNMWTTPIYKASISSGGFHRFSRKNSINYVLKGHIRKHNSFMVYCHPFELHDGYLPTPINILPIQRKYLKRNRTHYLGILKCLIDYLKENGYSFSNMKDFCLTHQKDY